MSREKKAIEITRVEVGDRHSMYDASGGGGFYGVVAREPGYTISIPYRGSAFVSDQDLARARAVRTGKVGEPDRHGNGGPEPPASGLLGSAFNLLGNLLRNR